MTDNNDFVNSLRRKPGNKACFDCNEKGVNYVVINFGVFVCSSCSGIHRQLNYKVKGLGMCNFTDSDVAVLKKWGNKKAKAFWMSDYNKTLYPTPDRNNDVKMKEFMRMKYVEKRFQESNTEEPAEDSDDDEHKKKKKKKRKKHHKKETSSDEEEDKSSSDTEEDEGPKIRRTRRKAPRKLAAPSTQPEKKAKKEKKQKHKRRHESSDEESEEEKKVEPTPQAPVQEVTSLFDDMGFGESAQTQAAPQQTQAPQNTGSSLLAAFETPSQPQAPAPKQEEPKPQAPNSSDLISNLGNLYAANQPAQQANPFAGFGAPASQAPPPSASNPFGAFGGPPAAQSPSEPASNGFTFPTNTPAPSTPQPTATPNDPFAGFGSGQTQPPPAPQTPTPSAPAQQPQDPFAGFGGPQGQPQAAAQPQATPPSLPAQNEDPFAAALQEQNMQNQPQAPTGMPGMPNMGQAPQGGQPNSNQLQVQ